MTIIARKIVVSPDARLTRDLYCDELKIMDEDGKVRDATPRDMIRISNGYRIYALGRITE